MTFSLFLNDLLKLYLSFCSEPSDCYYTPIFLFVLGLLCFLVKVLLTRTFWEKEHTQKGRAKRRRKSGTHGGCRYCQREEEDKKMLISLLKSPLGQRHDSIHFRRLLCPDPSCEVCNNATAEMGQLLSSLALEDATPSVSSLASEVPVTEPSFTGTSVFSAVPPGELISLPLPEPFPPPPSIVSPKPMTTLGDFSLLSSLATDALPSLASKFPMHHFAPQSLPMDHLPPCDTKIMGAVFQPEAPLTLNTIFIDSSIIQNINSSTDLAQAGNSTEAVSRPPHYSLNETQPKSITISSKPALESLDSTEAWSTRVLQGTDHPRLSISDFFCKDAHVKDPLPSTLAQRDYYRVKDMGSDAEKDLNTYIMSLSGAISMVSRQSVSQRLSENAWKSDLRKKSEEVSEGELTATAPSPWHAIQKTLSVQFHTKRKQRSLAPSVHAEYFLNTYQELHFLESSAQQFLEIHITKFHMRMECGLPAKVLESIEIFMLRDTSTHFLYDSESSCSTNVISEMDSKSEIFTAFRGSSTTLNSPCSATSFVGKEEPGTMRRSPPDSAHGLAEEVQRSQDAKQTPLPVTNSIIGKESERKFLGANIHSPKLPIRQSRASFEPKGQYANSNKGKKMEKLEPVSMPNVSRAGERDALPLKMSDILTTSKLGISQRINVSESKVVTTMTTKSVPAKTSALQGPKSADLQTQLMAELEKLEKRKHSQAQGQLTHMPQASDSLTCKASLTHAQGVSSVDGAAPQVLHVHVEDRGVHMEQPQEPCVPKYISSLCQRKNFPPVAKKARPIGFKAEDLGRGNAGLGTSQPGSKRFPTQDVPLKVRLGTKSLTTPSQKAQSHGENLFNNKIKHFFQWLHPGKKCEKQASSQEKGSPISSMQSRGPVKNRAAFTGLFREEKLGCQHAVDITCPQEPLPSAVKFGKAQQKAGVRAQAEPVQGHPSNSRAHSCEVTNTKSFYQEAVFQDKDRHPQIVLALKDQLLYQKNPQSMPRRGTAPPPRPTCRPPSALWPPAAVANAIMTVFRDPSILLREKSILDLFQGKGFPTPK